MKIDELETPLPCCARCRVPWTSAGSALCEACTRRFLSAVGRRRPAHRPEDDEPSPWQEIAIRFLEEQLNFGSA